MTPRQRDILEMIRDNVAREGVAPTLEELGRRAGVSSKATIHKHLAALEDAGAIRIRRGRARGIELTEAPAGPGGATVPLMGRVAAGRPIEAVANPENIEIPESFLAEGETYALQVKGDSMIDEGILDGDWVIVAARDTARDGEVVVALVDEEEATLKRLRRNGDRVILEPANAAYEAMEYPADRVRIQGAVVAQMRSYRR
jgi:repressor LexA